ncbi:lipase family protein [Campylobacter jejuni]|nr:lipase family protein [Campylobacter jejuni]
MIFDIHTFLKLQNTKILNDAQVKILQNLQNVFFQNLEFLEDLRKYSLLSHAAYLNLDCKEILFEDLDQKRLFRALSNNILKKESVSIGKIKPMLAFSLVKNFILKAHINENCNESKMGFRASLFQQKNSKKFILAIAGSDLRPLKFDFYDVWSDFLLLNGKIPEGQFKSLSKFYSLIKQRFKFSKITLVGHSLGGHLAQLFALNYPLEIDSIYTFQAPGIYNLAKKLEIPYKACHIYTLHNMNLRHFKWYNFNFVQKLHSKIGEEILLNLGTRIHHPSVSAKGLNELLKNLKA